MQRPLTTTFTTTDPTGGPSYTIQLPQAPEPQSVTSEPTSDGWVSFAGVRLDGGQFGALLLVKLGDRGATTPKGALEQEASQARGSRVLSPAGPIRKTMVGDTPAYAEDFLTAGGRHLREFRFARAGHLYGAGIVYDPDDRVSLDTGLAALQTLRWVG